MDGLQGLLGQTKGRGSAHGPSAPNQEPVPDWLLRVPGMSVCGGRNDGSLSEIALPKEHDSHQPFCFLHSAIYNMPC